MIGTSESGVWWYMNARIGSGTGGLHGRRTVMGVYGYEAAYCFDQFSQRG